VTVVSFYFFAGDFADVLQRYERQEQQIYQTHNELARMVHDLLETGHRVNLYSFITGKRTEEYPLKGLKIVNLGAADYSITSLLKAAVEKDDAEAIVAHFANLELLRAVSRSRARSIAVLANSYNKKGLKSVIEKYRVVTLLNNERFQLVSNHCLPATEHLSSIGVDRSKLIAWDVRHPFTPASYAQKAFVPRPRFELFYVGSITENKGVTDLVRAVALLRTRGLEVHCSLAGHGDINVMTSLASQLRVSDLFSFLGLVGNNEILKLMRASDVVAVPSRTIYPEGFPLVIFEAIASRTPIVCSDHPMFRPVLFDGRNASVFPAGNHLLFADAIKRILCDAGLYARLSLAAFSTWEALKGPADWRTMLTKWVNEGASSEWIQKHKLPAKRYP
jgi:glycosyltransferase involved in cell wall biosynthesis